MQCNFDLGQNKMVKQASIPLKSKRKSREVQNAPFSHHSILSMVEQVDTLAEEGVHYIINYLLLWYTVLGQ